MSGPHKSIKRPLDTYPQVWVIMVQPPKRSHCDPELVSYGFPGQPFPDQLLSRGAGMAFATKQDAEDHLRESVRRDKGAEYTKWLFRVVPVFLPYPVKRPRKARP